MFASVTSAALVGVRSSAVRVEAHVFTGGDKALFAIVGLPDTAVREARERVRSAILASGFSLPQARITVNLAPADLPKVGSAYDLPIALAVLGAARSISSETNCVALGELALDGKLRGQRGGLAAGIVARERDVPCLVASEAAAEASLCGARVVGVRSLAQAVAVLEGTDPGEPSLVPAEIRPDGFIDIAVVRGQTQARRALEVAAAGGHHLLLSGPPGSGKTLLARTLPGVLPDLTEAEQLDVAQARAAAGRRPRTGVRPPFRSPHHSATAPAILGGGSGVPVPGELTLADRGVLFLDELAEFPPYLLDSLRQPIEEGVVHVARKGVSVSFPARVQVVAATNPCPCGYLGDERKPCRCTPASADRYRRRLSGPLLDRFDLRVALRRVGANSMVGPPGEPASVVRVRVGAARAIQRQRGALNRSLGRAALDRMAWSDRAVQILGSAIDRLDLTGRGWDRVRRISRTIADLDARETIGSDDVSEALELRGPE